MTITVYSKPHCVQCEATKKRFTDNGVSFDVIDVTKDAEAMDLIISKGFVAAPVVNANGDWFSGFNPDKIDAVAA